MITRADVFPRAKAPLSLFDFFGAVVHLCVHLSPEQFRKEQKIVHPRRVLACATDGSRCPGPAGDHGGRPRAEKLLTSAVSLSFYYYCQRFSP